MWPQKCGEDLAECLKNVFFFTWNFRREIGMNTKVLNGVDPALVKVCTLDLIELLSKCDPYSTMHITSTAGFTMHTSALTNTGLVPDYSSTLKDKCQANNSHKTVVNKTISQKRKRAEQIELLPQPRLDWNPDRTDILSQLIVVTPKRSDGNRDWEAIALTASRDGRFNYFLTANQARNKGALLAKVLPPTEIRQPLSALSVSCHIYTLLLIKLIQYIKLITYI